MKFHLGTQPFCLKGMASKKLQVVEGPLSDKSSSKAIHFCLLQILHPTDATPTLLMSTLSEHGSLLELTAIRKLNEDLCDVFTEPNEVPPERGVFNHRIPLEEGTQPINVRPYRYPLKHRDN